MRHGVSGRKLNRTTSHRLAMFRNMVTSLLNHERIYTTVPKAKEMRRWAEWMITLGKHGDLHSRRQALSVIREKNVVHKVFDELAQRYQNRAGGYTRIVKVGFRRGDASPMCMLELITEGGEKGGKKGKKSRKKAETAAAKTESSTS
ncbi:MAG: 50S ribosomal protein L17 [Syntrophobacteraceae bacterium]|jgi:large subunit ribosomal protein L17